MVPVDLLASPQVNQGVQADHLVPAVVDTLAAVEEGNLLVVVDNLHLEVVDIHPGVVGIPLVVVGILPEVVGNHLVVVVKVLT